MSKYRSYSHHLYLFNPMAVMQNADCNLVTGKKEDPGEAWWVLLLFGSKHTELHMAGHDLQMAGSAMPI